MTTKYEQNNTRVAVIGCGNWGKNLIRVFHELGALIAVCDIDSTKAEHFRKQYGVHSLSLNEILSAKDIDAVVIAAPSYTHDELGAACLRANKHVFIEKPLAITLKNAKLLDQLAKEKERVLMVGHLLHYHRAFMTLKELKAEGVLGDLQYLTSHRFNFGKFPTEESVLLDFAPHDVSMILSLLGENPLQVTATGGNHLHHTRTDTAHIHMHFKENCQAHVCVSWLHPFKEQKLIAVGSKAMAIFDDCQPWDAKLRLCRYPATWSDGLPHPFPSTTECIPLEPMEPLLNEAQHFLECIHNSLPPRTRGEEGINVMAVLDAAAHSMADHETITLGQELPTTSRLPSEQVAKESAPN